VDDAFATARTRPEIIFASCRVSLEIPLSMERLPHLTRRFVRPAQPQPVFACQ
jgi:hypothetical protein